MFFEQVETRVSSCLRSSPSSSVCRSSTVSVLGRRVVEPRSYLQPVCASHVAVVMQRSHSTESCLEPPISYRVSIKAREHSLEHLHNKSRSTRELRSIFTTMEVASTPKSNMFEQKSSRVKWSSSGSSELTGFLIFVVCISYTLVLAVAAVTLEIFFVTLRLLFSGECRFACLVNLLINFRSYKL